ncbi:hypothetical protein RBG61_03930 [Paludicola sp. MB14-C6]|uniref:anti-sigma-I factor RsgI family protein n=1 Tax=Paludihabitans sp. MB14-C6 TaxID=3070656 RepID=UPI0027DCD2B4|nr:hypothetical protein [Paludicola sp. MB14-C6]WMJ23825.1 hypothetical protein RBG61_03930 [Paludicola sp. MB14-C6]
MKRKIINERLQKAIYQIAPDVYDQVSTTYVKPIEREDFTMKNSAMKTLTPKRLILAFSAIAIALCILIGGITISSTNKIDSVISLDVNPSIEIATNKADEVIQVNALNEDAKIVTNELELEHTDIEDAIPAIIDSMVENGYINEDKNAILVSVSNEDPNKTENLENIVETDINETLEDKNIEGNIIKQNANNDKSIAKQAEQYGISANKMAFIRNIMKKDSSITLEQLLPLNITELMKFINNKHIPVDEVTNKPHKKSSASSSENSISSAPENKNASSHLPASKENKKEEQNSSLSSSSSKEKIQNNNGNNKDEKNSSSSSSVSSEKGKSQNSNGNSKDKKNDTN